MKDPLREALERNGLEVESGPNSKNHGFRELEGQAYEQKQHLIEDVPAALNSNQAIGIENTQYPISATVTGYYARRIQEFSSKLGQTPEEFLGIKSMQQHQQPPAKKHKK